MKRTRHPFEKESFLEGTRQRWCFLFCVIGLLVLVMTSYGFLQDPTPFLTFFTGIGVTFILGASASSVMNSYKVDSSTYSEAIKEQVRQEFVDGGRAKDR